MFLTHLSLTNFRIFTRLDVTFPPGKIILVGDNAQGKTSLLEAIYFLATVTSFHAQNDRQLMNFMALEDPQAVTRLVGDFTEEGESHHLEIRLILENGMNGGSRLRKEVLLDGVRRKLADTIGCFLAVIFLPQMSRILENGPEERRRYINLALSQAIPGYAQALSDYTQAVTQRNALLKQLAERGGDRDQLSFWDEILSRQGAFLILARAQAIEELERIASRIHHRLTRSQEVLRLCYQPAFDPIPPKPQQFALPIETPLIRSGIALDQIRKGFLQRLSEIRQEEVDRGMTIIGPHRDELRFLANSIDLGEYGSRGQVRSTILALKLAEAVWLKEKTGHNPTLLFDELLVELDYQRREDTLNLLEDYDQVMITTTDLNLFQKDFVDKSTLWCINSGCVTPKNQ